MQIVFMEFKCLNEFTNGLVNSFNNCIRLRIASSDRFLHSIIIRLLFELMSNEFLATIKSDLCWPKLSGKPFLFGNVCNRNHCLFVVILMDLEPAGCGIYHGNTFAYKVFCLFLQIVYGPMKSSHILFQGIASASFSGRCPNFLEALRLFS
jgi:hypothetical protein